MIFDMNKNIVDRWLNANSTVVSQSVLPKLKELNAMEELLPTKPTALLARTVLRAFNNVHDMDWIKNNVAEIYACDFRVFQSEFYGYILIPCETDECFAEQLWDKLYYLRATQLQNYQVIYRYQGCKCSAVVRAETAERAAEFLMWLNEDITNVKTAEETEAIADYYCPLGWTSWASFEPKKLIEHQSQLTWQQLYLENNYYHKRIDFEDSTEYSTELNDCLLNNGWKCQTECYKRGEEIVYYHSDEVHSIKLEQWF